MTAHAHRPALRLVVSLALVVAVWPASLAARATSARERYEAALVLDRDARAAGEKSGADEDRTRQTVRRAIDAYEAVVRRFPTSGYCDNALMRGGDLAQWLFARSGQAADRNAAAKYYAWLLREYPVSGLRVQARAAAQLLEHDPSVAATRPPASAATRRAPAAAVPAILRGIDRSVVGNAVRVTLSLDRDAPFAHELIEGPRRAFVDLFGVAATPDLQDAALRYDADTVRQVRVGTRPGATRVVLDLDGTSTVSVFTLYNPFRVVIDAERSAVVVMPPPVFLSGAAPPVVVTPALVHDDIPVAPRDENELTPAVPPFAPKPSEPPVGSAPAATSTRVPPRPAEAPRVLPSGPAPEAVVEWPAAVPSEPTVNGDGSFSLARQLGLGISRIVIDAGHGGHDPGTLTEGSTEARIVLDVALRLEKLLQKEAGLEVVLTRRTDVFIPLEQRTAIANRAGADLFLSIHANSGRDRTARGVETYFLSFASNPEAEAVAARENAASASDMHNLPSIVRAITLNNKLDESRDLAMLVQQSLSTRLVKANAGIRSRGVKKAPFVVLIGAGMPSVLTEIGFVTNKQEAALMRTPAYRQRIAEALHLAVMQYRRGLKRQTAVAAR